MAKRLLTARFISPFIIGVLACSALEAQTTSKNVWTVKADSVKFTNCDSSEFILENHTQNVPGFLFNTGNGRTIFKRAVQKINDSLFIIGADTLKIKNSSSGWAKGGNSFGTTGILGTLDSNHIDFYTNNTRRGRWTNTGDLLLGTTTDGGYLLDANGTARVQSKFVVNSTVSGNTGPFTISPNATAVGNQGDFTIAVNNGARLFVTSYGTTFSGAIVCTGLTSGPIYTGNISTAGSVFIQPTGGNFDNFIYMGAGGSTRKAAIIEKALGSYSRMDMNFALNNVSDTSSVTASDTKVVFKANGNVLIGSTTDNGSQLQVAGSSSLGGSVRLAGLTNDNTQTRVLVSDASGNLYYRDASSIATNDVIHSSLAVNGTISAKKLQLSASNWPDYVFDSSYRIMPLGELESYIRRNSHLPDMVSAKEAESDGIDVGKNQAALLRKIEELTLYSIGQQKKLDEQQKKVEDMQKEIEELRKLITDQKGGL